MTPHQTLAVAVRLFAIWLAIHATRNLLGVYLAGRDRGDTYIVPFVGVLSLLAIVFIVVLWFFPKTIAHKLLTPTNDAPANPSTPESWLVVGSSLIGLWLVASAVPGLLRNLFTRFLFRSESVEVIGLAEGFVYLVAQAVVGAALIFGANSVKRFILWARYAGPD